MARHAENAPERTFATVQAAVDAVTTPGGLAAEAQRSGTAPHPSG